MTPRSRAHAWYVLGLLTTVNFANYVDRMVIVSMYDDLRRRFQFTDGQLGAFWSAFFVVHAALTVPLGWAGDRFDRRRVMAIGVITWSLATLGSAYAIGFVSLLCLRGLVGIGEAAYGPVANAVVCETFRPGEKARVIAIYNGGMFAGAAIGMSIGGLLGFPLAFQVVALPGLALGVAVALLRIPPRRVDERPTASLPTVGVLVRDARRALRPPTLRWMLAGGILISFAAGGYIAWFTDFVLRYKGFTLARATVTFGAIAVTGGICGVLAGGAVADRLQRRWHFGRVLTIAIGFLASLPFALLTIFVDRGLAFLASAWLLMFFIPWYNGPMAAVIDDVVDDREASTAQASFSFLLHLVGTGPASLVVGLASETVGLRMALLLPVGATLLAAGFCLAACRHVEADMRSRASRAGGRESDASGLMRELGV